MQKIQLPESKVVIRGDYMVNRERDRSRTKRQSERGRREQEVGQNERVTRRLPSGNSTSKSGMTEQTHIEARKTKARE